MRTFDLTGISGLHEVFPELTPAQFETALLFCPGLSKGEIAHLRSVSYPAIKKTLDDIAILFNFGYKIYSENKVSTSQ